MEESTSLKLIMEKGPREGETLIYSSRSIVKIGRVVKGNTIGIKDAGISSKHMSIQFDNQLRKWTIRDLDSSNGTILNGQVLKPCVPSALADDDRIKIGELTSIIVKIEVGSTIQPRRNPRRQGKVEAGAGVGSAAVVEGAKTELGFGFDGDLGKVQVKEPIQKRKLRTRAKKDLDSKNEVEKLSSMRILRSSKKEEVSCIPSLDQFPEKLSLGVKEIVDLSLPVESKTTRGRKKKMVDQLPVDPDLDKQKPEDIVVPAVGKRTRGRRKGLFVEPTESLNTANESIQVDEGNEVAIDKPSVDPLENLGSNNESAKEQVVEKLGSTQECCEGKNIIADQSSSKGKKVANESDNVTDGHETGHLPDLEKMTLGDFFDYLEVQIPKMIYDQSEKIIADLEEKARKCYEFRLQHKK